jgi:two-component system, OmpR family, response regulator MprA
MDPMTAGRVLVVDDEPEVRLSLRRALELESYDVVCAEGGEAALELLHSERFDVVILDVNMPKLDGLATCRRLRNRGDNVPVLMLTAKNRMIDQVVGLDFGADDYLAKPFDLDVLYARLRSLLRRANGKVAGIHHLGDLTVDVRSRRVDRNGQTLPLTPREYDLVELLVMKADEVVHRDRICEGVWGPTSDVSANSLDVFVGTLRRKMEANGQPRLIHTVRGVGYVARTEFPH